MAKDESKYNNLLWAFQNLQKSFYQPADHRIRLEAHIENLNEELATLKKNYNWVCDRLKQLEKK